MNYILSIDIGTTALKSAVFDDEGRLISSKTLEYTILTPRSGWAEMDVNTYVETFRVATHAVITEAGIEPEEILTIGMSAQGETTIFLDHHYRPLRNAIVWFDTRAAEEAKQIVEHFGPEEIQRRTGQVGMDAIWPAAKLMWLRRHEPEVFSRIHKAVQLKGYLCWLLTGCMACEDSILGSSLYFDINTRSYWPDALDLIGISEEQLPQIRRPGEDIGHVSPEAAMIFGLSTQTTVNIGSMDLSCGAIGTGAVHPGDFSDSTGSALCTMSMVDHIVLDPAMQMPCYCSAIPGMYMIHSYSTGGMFMRWFRDTFCAPEMDVERSGGINAYDQLDAMAAKIPVGADGLIALPHLQGSGPPDQSAQAKAVFAGLTIAHGKAHFVRAIMESIVMVLRRIIEATERLDSPVRHIVDLSGGAKSALWCQMKADATGREVCTTEYNEHAPCLGAAILAGTARGLWPSVEAAADRIVRADRRFLPHPELKPAYDELFEQYLDLMGRMDYRSDR